LPLKSPQTGCAEDLITPKDNSTKEEKDGLGKELITSAVIVNYSTGPSLLVYPPTIYNVCILEISVRCTFISEACTKIYIKFRTYITKFQCFCVYLN
jgi:hypothetical protein